jgi:hypothetical protein
MAEAPRSKELSTDYTTVPLIDPEGCVPLSDAAALMALDHQLMQKGLKDEEDPLIRAQLEAVIRAERGQLQEGEEVPMILMKDPGVEAWDVESLQQVVQSAYSAFVEYTRPGPGEDGWRMVDHSHPREDWCLLEKQGADGVFRFRFEGTVFAPADRIAHANRDVDFTTRCRWDTEDLKPIHLKTGNGQTLVLPAVRRRGPRLIRPYKSAKKQARMQRRGRAPMDRCLEIIETYIHPPSFGGIPIPGVATRRMLAVQWGMYDSKAREYVLLTPTLEDVPKDEALFGCPGSCVDVTGLAGMRLISDRGDSRRTHVTMVVAINPNGNIPERVVTWGREKLLERAALIEKVCQDETFTEVYGTRK